MTAVLFLLPWLAVCGYAAWRGGQPERFVAIMFLIAFPLGAFLNAKFRSQGIQIGSFSVDVAMLILLLAIALKANRYWPMGMVAMQLLEVVGHLLKLADPRMMPLLYWISSVMWAYPMLILLALGTLRHRNRIRRLGPESSWSSSSPPPG
jgi:uncharacterized membrane-anchored protein